MKKGTYRRVQKAYGLVNKGIALSKAVKTAGTNYSTYMKYIDTVRGEDKHTSAYHETHTESGDWKDTVAGFVINAKMSTPEKIRTVRAIYSI